MKILCDTLSYCVISYEDIVRGVGSVVWKWMHGNLSWLCLFHSPIIKRKENEPDIVAPVNEWN